MLNHAIPSPLWKARVTPTATTAPGIPADGEAVLVERASAGDRAAFGQLYQKHVEAVFAYVQLRVRDRTVAEDLTQDIFINAFRALAGGRFVWQGSFAPWLLRCAHNRVVNHWRSMGRQPEISALPDERDDAFAGPELADEMMPLDEALANQLTTEAINGAMTGLTELQQQVMSLRFGAGLTLTETAAVLGRTPNAVKNLQHNALVALRRALVTPGRARP